jgi:hypothetical protein
MLRGDNGMQRSGVKVGVDIDGKASEMMHA